MTDRFPVPPTDRQRDDLDALLGDLAAGRDGDAGVLDAGLAGTVRLVHRALSEPVGVDPRERARRWAALSDGSDAMVLGRPARPAPASRLRAGSTGQSAHARRLDPRSPIPRLVAVLLGLLLVAGSLAAILTGGRGDAPPTMIPAAWVATPEATPSGEDVAVERVNVVFMADSVLEVRTYRPRLGVCDVEPVPMEQLARILGGGLGVSDQGIPRITRDPTVPMVIPPPRLSFLLIAGIEQTIATDPNGYVDGAIRDAAVSAWATYRTCDLSRESQRTARVLTDDAVRRVAYSMTLERTPFFGFAIANPRPVSELSDFGDAPDRYAIGGFTWLDDSTVVALILEEGEMDGSGTVTQVRGMVSFVETDGRWLVDEFTWLQG